MDGTFAALAGSSQTRTQQWRASPRARPSKRQRSVLGRRLRSSHWRRCLERRSQPITIVSLRPKTDPSCCLLIFFIAVILRPASAADLHPISAPDGATRGATERSKRVPCSVLPHSFLHAAVHQQATCRASRAAACDIVNAGSRL